MMPLAESYAVRDADGQILVADCEGLLAIFATLADAVAYAQQDPEAWTIVLRRSPLEELEVWRRDKEAS